MSSHKLFVSLVLVIGAMLLVTQGHPLIGGYNQFEEISSKYSENSPIFVYCDELGYHLNCMMRCKSLGYSSGHCASDSICNCL